MAPMLTKTTFGTFSLSSGSLGGQTYEMNRKNLHVFPYAPDMMEDSFIHLLSVGEFTFTTSSSFSLACVPCYHLFYLYEGTLKLTMPDTSLTGRAGHALFLCSQNRLDFKLASGKCRFFHAVLAGAALNRYASLIPQDISCAPDTFGASRLQETMQKLLAQDEYTSDVLVITRSKWVNDILTELCVYHADSTRKKECIPDYILAMKELLDSEYALPFSLEDMERRLDKSRYRLCREFSRCFGQSPLQYVNQRRIEEAKFLLLTTDLPVHEVGSRVGIENTNHFINLFKRKTGATPLVFKQEAPVSISGLHYPCTPDGRPQ